jgi:hypothetical protein
MNHGQESLRTLVNSACTGTPEYYAYWTIPVILHKKYFFQSLIQLQFRVYCTALHHIALSLTLYRLTARLSVLRTNTQRGSSTAPSSAITQLYTVKQGQDTNNIPRRTPCATDTNHHTWRRHHLTNNKPLSLGEQTHQELGPIARSIVKR